MHVADELRNFPAHIPVNLYTASTDPEASGLDALLRESERLGINSPEERARRVSIPLRWKGKQRLLQSTLGGGSVNNLFQWTDGSEFAIEAE